MSLRSTIAVFVAILALAAVSVTTAGASNGVQIFQQSCNLSYGDTQYANGTGLVAMRDGQLLWETCLAGYMWGPRLTSAVPVRSGTCMTVFGPTLAVQRCTF